MKRISIIAVTIIFLSGCGNSVEPTPVDEIADKWQTTCQSLPNSESCHAAADKVRDQATVYGYEIGDESFRSQISFPLTDNCSVKNPPKECSAEFTRKNMLGVEGLTCVSDSPLGSICFAKILIRNIESGAINLRLDASLVDTEGNLYEPNVSGGISYKYLPLNFTSQFAKKLNPGQSEYWDVAFNVSGKLDGYSKIYLYRVGPSGGETIFLLPVKDEDSNFQTYEEAWYTNVTYSRSEATMWQPEFSRTTPASE
jgi:hypothetical protein